MNTTLVCTNCEREPMEDFGDGEPGPWCIRCNNRAINAYENEREWNYYHPGESCPECELNKTR